MSASGRAFLYCRQSSTDGDGTTSLSLVSQERLLRDLAESRGLVVVGVEVDADLRGWQDERERPGLASTLARAASGEYEALLVYDTSRVARSVRILENTMHALESHGARIISLKEPWLDDPLVRQILGAVAEKTTRDLRDHSRRGIAERTRRGLHHGVAPYGYLKLAPDAPLVVDVTRPERAAIVHEVFERISNGATYTEVAADLNARGIESATGRGWSMTTIRGTVRRAAYRGAVEAGDLVRENAHEAIVPPELWHRAAERVTSPAYHRRKRKAESSWLEGFVMHECGARAYLVPEQRPRESGGTRAYFRCLYAHGRERQSPAGARSCGQYPKTVTRDRLEEEVWSIVAHDLARIIPAELAIRYAEEEYARLAPDAARLRRELDTALAKIEAHFHRAESLYLDGKRSRDWLNEHEARIAEERRALRARLDELPPEPDAETIAGASVILHNLTDELPAFADVNRRLIMARLGVVSFGPTGVHVVYEENIARLIPGAHSLGGQVTIGASVLSPMLLTSLRLAFAANRAILAA